MSGSIKKPPDPVTPALRVPTGGGTQAGHTHQPGESESSQNTGSLASVQTYKLPHLPLEPLSLKLMVEVAGSIYTAAAFHMHLKLPYRCVQRVYVHVCVFVPSLYLSIIKKSQGVLPAHGDT